jgi:hypothetical protein
LRDAANIVGFCEFPVGWSWAEYKLFSRIPPPAYEERAKIARLLGIAPDEAERTSAGRDAEILAEHFRRNQVEQLLQRFIRRKEVGIIIYDEHMRGNIPSKKLRLDATAQINVDQSSYGFPDLQWHCVFDAIRLVKVMGPRRWRDERTKDYDWLRIERYVRTYFETRGCPERKEDAFDSVVKQLNNANEGEPSAASLKEFVATIRKEYEGSD